VAIGLDEPIADHFPDQPPADGVEFPPHVAEVSNPDPVLYDQFVWRDQSVFYVHHLFGSLIIDVLSFMFGGDFNAAIAGCLLPHRGNQHRK
jgi:hypothetical protein